MPLDIELDENRDVKIYNGGLRRVESTNKHKDDILYAHPGEYRQFLLTGIGIRSSIHDDDLTDLSGLIRTQFESDGMRVKKVRVNKLLDNIQVTDDSYYERDYRKR